VLVALVDLFRLTAVLLRLLTLLVPVATWL